MTFAFTQWTWCFWGDWAGSFQTSGSCHPLRIPFICKCHQYFPSHVSWKSLDTSISPLQTSNLLPEPVYSIFLFIYSQMFAEPLCGLGLGQSPGNSALGGPARPLLPSPQAYILLRSPLSYLDLSVQALKWPGLALQQSPNWISFLYWPSRILLLKQRTQNGWPSPPALSKSLLGSALPAEVHALQSGVMFLYGVTHPLMQLWVPFLLSYLYTGPGFPPNTPDSPSLCPDHPSLPLHMPKPMYPLRYPLRAISFTKPPHIPP